MMAPEFVPEIIALANGALQLRKTQAGPGVVDATKVRVDLTDRYKQAIKSMEANPQKKAVGFQLAV